MAGKGPAPAPPEQRRRRNQPVGGEWITLPRAGRKGPVPKWPLSKCTPQARGLWQRLWRTPQATQWEGAGVGTELSVARYVILTLELGDLPELRQIEDRLGLNPKGMQDRRWRLEESDEMTSEAGPARPGPAARRHTSGDRRAKIIELVQRGPKEV